MKITVAIATWNRADLLDRTLESFHQLRIPAGVSWELIVVNNNSNDRTEEVLEHHARFLPLRGVFEAKQGVSHAKNRAVELTTGDLMLWTDDDVLVDPGWLEAFHDAALAWPEACYFGGAIEPLYEVPPPRWIERNADLIRGPLVICNPGDTVRPVRGDECPYGASMAFRSEVFDELRFNPRLGRKGEGQIRGEETEVLERLQRKGRMGVWVPQARVHHHVPASRMTQKYIWEWSFAGGVGTIRQFGIPIGNTLLGFPIRAILRHFKYRAATLLHAFGSSRRWLQAYRKAASTRGVLAGVAEELQMRRGERLQPVHGAIGSRTPCDAKGSSGT